MEVELSAVLGLLDSNQFVCVLGLCHSFKIYALPPALSFKFTFGYVESGVSDAQCLLDNNRNEQGLPF